MQAIARREDIAFGELYDRYGVRMFRFFLRMFGRNTSLAEDFTQELFLKILEKAAYFNPEKSFRTWVYVLAYNMCKNEYRRLGRTATFEPEKQDVEQPRDLHDRGQFDAALRAVIDGLSEAHRECFVLRFQEDLTVMEIAQIVECPEGTVKSRLYHALRQVCRELEPWREVFR